MAHDAFLLHPQDKDATVIQKQYGGVEGLAKALRSNTTEGIDTNAAGGTSVESRKAAYGFNRCSPVTQTCSAWSLHVVGGLQLSQQCSTKQ